MLGIVRMQCFPVPPLRCNILPPPPHDGSEQADFEMTAFKHFTVGIVICAAFFAL